MDKKTEIEIADLYASKLFSTKDIGRRYGVPHQRVTAVGWQVEQEGRRARIDAFRDEHGVEGRVPKHLLKEFYLAYATAEERGRLVVESPGG
jgi:hypothetical protein